MSSGAGIDFARFEILQRFEPQLADLHIHHVEDFAGRNGQFAPDDLVLGLGVAANLDLLDVALLAFIDHELQVHRAALRIGNSADDQLREELLTSM